ncbi:MAG: alpha/beta fold hydrolase, partial [Candidatus Daviesbacteria bacterium]|nr:alpha/beta fold hydrolase [Candidatus Daviesbacteria bacterium]
MKKQIFLFGLLILLGIGLYFQKNQNKPQAQLKNVNQSKGDPHPLQISEMRKKDYPGSEITIEEELEPGSNYSRYLASYRSEGLKINALLTVPEGDPPVGGWPAIVFNHGYIPPAEYSTTSRYVAYTNAFSSNGYAVLKPDYRGHGSSEGKPEGGYYSPAYTVDVLNALSSIKKYPGVNPEKIGMWGHSMGGSLTLRSMVVSKDIKAGVIWAGVVGSYEDMIKNWRRSRPFMLSEREQAFRRPGRQALIDKYGDPDKNPEFWESISPIYFVKDISGPLQLHHGTVDEEVPLLFSERLKETM